MDRSINFSEQRGSALVMVVLLALVATAVGGTLLMMSNSDHMISANERDAERALYASRAGLSYAYYLYEQALITPSDAGTAFDSFASDVSTPLDGGQFTGSLIDLSATMNQGQLYMIRSTGRFGRASRTTEMVFQIVPEAFKYGYMAFSQVALHNHSGLAGPTFRVRSTVLANGDVEVAPELTLDGSIIASGTVDVKSNATVTKDIFANAVANDGTIEGKVRLLSAVMDLPADAVTYDIVDDLGDKYAWFDGNSTPGSLSGNAPLGGQSSYTIQNGDEFLYNIFRRNGTLIANPQINVTKYVKPPKLDYQAMKVEADKNDPTYFATSAEAVTYLISKKVNETIGGRSVTVVRVGTPDAPELLYIRDDFSLEVSPGAPDSPSAGKIQADALFIEGGIYITGTFDFDGPDFPAATPQYPLPPDFYALKINALPYCYPALLAYEEPATGSIATWTPDDTPVMGSGAKIQMSGGDEGPAYFNGLVMAQTEIHMHHTTDERELIIFNGAELAWKVHNCDFFQFSYDPAVRCTRFLISDQGTPEVVNYREVR